MTMSRFLLIFIVLLLALSFAYKSDAISRTIVTPWNYILAESSFHLIDPIDNDAQLSGNVLSNTKTGFTVSVEDDCNAIEATLILISAIMASPSRALSRAVGAIVGLLSIQLLNLIRIISLYFLGQWNTTIFDWAHQYAWPALILLFALLFFAVWYKFASTDSVETALERPRE